MKKAILILLICLAATAIGLGAADAATDLLSIDTTAKYDGMGKSYEQGYIPSITGGTANFVLPLNCADDTIMRITVTPLMGTENTAPFPYVNYRFDVDRHTAEEAFVIRLSLPLKENRVNGTYAVTFHIEYNYRREIISQEIPVYLTITDGIEAISAFARDTIPVAQKPDLFISRCEVAPGIVAGGSDFTVELAVDNIGTIQALGARLSYGSDQSGILPAQTDNTLLLNAVAPGDSIPLSLKLKTTADVLAGVQSFFIRLDYTDAYGNQFDAEKTYQFEVTQPTEIAYDPVRVPETVVSGEKIDVPVSVFNTGKSPLRDVTVSISAPGLYPYSSAFLGDIDPGKPGIGTISLYIGTLPYLDESSSAYGAASGTYTITYHDDAGVTHAQTLGFSTEINQPADEDTDILPPNEQAALQWWIAALVAFGVIALLTASMIVTKTLRLLRVRDKPCA
jgi:hypothetical protein